MYQEVRSNLRALRPIRLALLCTLVVLSACAVPPGIPTPSPVPRPGTLPTASPNPMMAPTRPEATQPSGDLPATSVPPTPTQMPTQMPTETPAASAQYQLTFEATWSVATHPTDFPPNPHFSGLIGAAHSSDVRLWAVGEMATPGIKVMAETGGKNPLEREIDALIGAGGACAVISGGGINPSPGVVAVTFTVDQACPLVSVVSMIAPSPDWFVGVAGLNLFEDGAWVDNKVVELLPYDAGTDSGSSYASPNAPTSSPEAIHRIEVEPLLIDGRVPSFGTFTFSRLDP